MLKLVVSRTAEQFSATQKKAVQALKEKGKVPQESTEFLGRFRTLRVADPLLRLDNEAADKKAAGQEQKATTLTANG